MHVRNVILVELTDFLFDINSYSYSGILEVALKNSDAVIVVVL